MSCPPRSPGESLIPSQNRILPLLDGSSADTEGHHLCLPAAFHIPVDISELINLFHGGLRGGVQGDNHEVLDSWGTGKRRRSHAHFPEQEQVQGTLLERNRLSFWKAQTALPGSSHFWRGQPVAERWMLLGPSGGCSQSMKASFHPFTCPAKRKLVIRTPCWHCGCFYFLSFWKMVFSTF